MEIKNLQISYITYIFLCAFSCMSYSLVVGPIKIYGKVHSYGNKEVVLAQNDGRKTRVPVDSIVKNFEKLQTGYCVVAEIKEDQLKDILTHKEENSQ